MKKPNFTIFAVVITTILLCAPSIYAQQVISTEKKALILEIRQLTGMAGLSVKQKISNETIDNARIITFIENDKDLSNNQKQELKKSSPKEINEFKNKCVISRQTNLCPLNCLKQHFSNSMIKSLPKANCER